MSSGHKLLPLTGKFFCEKSLKTQLIVQFSNQRAATQVWRNIRLIDIMTLSLVSS